MNKLRCPFVGEIIFGHRRPTNEDSIKIRHLGFHALDAGIDFRNFLDAGFQTFWKPVSKIFGRLLPNQMEASMQIKWTSASKLNGRHYPNEMKTGVQINWKPASSSFRYWLPHHVEENVRAGVLRAGMFFFRFQKRCLESSLLIDSRWWETHRQYPVPPVTM